MSISKNILSNLKAKKAFFVCLGISFLFWLLIKLSNTYDTHVSFRISLDGLADSSLIENLEGEKVDIHVRGHGYGLLAYYLGSAKEHTLDKWNNVSLNEEGWYKAYFLPNRNKAFIQSKLPEGVQLISSDQDSVTVIYSPKVERLLPIKLSQKPKPVSNRVILDLTFNKDSILVKGPLSILSKLDSVPVWNEEFSALSSIENKKVILFTELEGIELLESKFRYNSVVSAMAERSFQVPVSVVNAWTKIQILPEKVTLKCQAPILLLDEINPDMFKVIAMADSTKSSWKLQLAGSPINLFSHQFIPEKVEYLTLSP